MKNKSNAFFWSFILTANVTWAQQVDYNRIIPTDASASISYEERLVQLAWQNNPVTSMAERNISIAEYNLKTIKTEWGNQFGVNGNLNEFTIKSFQGDIDPLSRANFYPRYNVYVHVPLASFIQRPNQRKAAENRVAYALDELNLMKLEIRTRVLKLHKEYLKNKDVYEIRKKADEDELSLYGLIEEKFKLGGIDVLEYLNAMKSRSQQKEYLVTAKNLLDQSKLDLEEVIGIRIEDVVR